MLKKLLRMCVEEFRRAINGIVMVHEYVRALDEHVLRSLGVILRGGWD
jgi:hypothetical protein